MLRPDTTSPPSRWMAMPPTPRRFGMAMSTLPSGARRRTPALGTSEKYRLPSSSQHGPSTSPYPPVMNSSAVTPRFCRAAAFVSGEGLGEPPLVALEVEGSVGPHAVVLVGGGLLDVGAGGLG